MKVVLFSIVFILLFSSQVSAIKIGVSPQEIILTKTKADFTIFNPNPEQVHFQIQATKGIFLEPEKGIIKANSKQNIQLKSYEAGNILVKFLHNNLEPGIQIKVKKPNIPNYGLIIFFSIITISLSLLGIYLSLSYFSIL